MSIPRRLALALLTLGSLLGTPAEAADSVRARRSDRLVETEHQVQVVMDRGHARLIVRRTVFNGGPRHDETTFYIELPTGAVATGLKTLGSERGRPKWFEGDLMEAEAAAAKYRELTGIGGYYPKDPALLSWRSQLLLALQVFPCPPGEAKTIEYTLKLPTHFEDGAHVLELNRMGTETLAATFLVRAARKGDEVTLNGRNLAPSTPLRPKADEALSIRLETHDSKRFDGVLAVQGTSRGRFVRRLEVNTGRLSEVPEHADVVVLIDGSRSVDENLQRGALAATHAYLSHFPDASVQLVVFDRKLRRPLGDFRPAEEAMLEIARLAIRRRNGSDVEQALFDADRSLAGRPKGRERRIVLFTDALTHSKITPSRLRAAVQTSGALVHVGILNGTGAAVERNDDHPWDLVTRPAGGLVWNAWVDENAPAELISSYEEWVRPLRLDHVELQVGEATLEHGPGALAEGEGYADLALDSRYSSSATLRGQLWSTPVQKTLGRSARASRLWSALVFGSHLLHELEEVEMMPLAMYGGAVSPVTSYLAVEPGVRPSTEGLEHGFGTGFGRLGAPRVRMGGTKVSGPRFDHHTWLSARLATAWQECGGQGTAIVGFETTLAEIVLVDEARGLTQKDPLANRCLELFVWDLELPDAFQSPHEGWQIFVDA